VSNKTLAAYEGNYDAILAQAFPAYSYSIPPYSTSTATSATSATYSDYKNMVAPFLDESVHHETEIDKLKTKVNKICSLGRMALKI